MIGPLLSPGRKDLVTTGLGPGRVWATLGQGIVQEVFWPTPGEPQVRDLGFIVAGDGWWHEVKAVADYRVRVADWRVPVATAVHSGPPGNPYTLTLEAVCDDERDAMLLRYELEGAGSLYLLLAPHLHEAPAAGSAGGTRNIGWSDGGRLFAGEGGRFLCLAAAGGGLAQTSVGYFGWSDLWHDFADDGRMSWSYERAGPGVIVLGARLADASGVIALAFADDAGRAEATAGAALAAGFTAVHASFERRWLAWGDASVVPPQAEGDPPGLADALHWSAAVIKVHQDRGGAIVASLATPWGERGNDRGGYHLVWPRDAVEAGGALLALGHADDARLLLDELVARQLPDGHWHQNFFPDGTPFWTGVQLDETALPVLLAAALDEAGEPPPPETVSAVGRALAFLAQHGPLTEQDRWEEDPGGSPFTLATIVAALVAGAPYLSARDADYALGLADSWNERIEEWTYVTGSYLDQVFGLDGHYVRVGPLSWGSVRIGNHGPGLDVPTAGVLGMEFVYLARFGLRRADDPRLLQTMRLVDALLGRDLGVGTAYYRYSYDGYGESIDGGSFDGTTGLGRPWPLLAGERGQHALLSGGDPGVQLAAMLRMRSDSGLVPEQVWDQPPLVARPPGTVPTMPLLTGRPTLSATPLVWGHAELVKLALSRHRGSPVDRPARVAARYRGVTPTPARVFWRDTVPVTQLAAGRDLVIEAREPFTLHYGHDAWAGATDRASQPLGLGMHGVTLAAAELGAWHTLDFTRRFDHGWENTDHTVALGVAAVSSLPVRGRH